MNFLVSWPHLLLVLVALPFQTPEEFARARFLAGDERGLRAAAESTPDLLLLVAEEAVVEAWASAEIGARLETAAAAASGDVRARLDRLHAILASSPARFASLRELSHELDRATFRHEPSRALELARAAVEAARDLGLDALAYRFEESVLAALADLYRGEDVESHARALFAAVDGTPFVLARAVALSRIAQAEHAAGDVKGAWAHVSASLEVLRRHAGARELAFAADEGGWIAGSDGRIAASLALFDESAAAAAAAGDHDRLARAIRSRGLMLRQVGRNDEALVCLERALQVARDHGLDWRRVDVALRCAEILHRRGRREEAETAFQEAEVSLRSRDVPDAWLEGRRLRLRWDWCADAGAPTEGLVEETQRLLDSLAVRDQFPLLKRLVDDAVRRGNLALARDRSEKLLDLGSRLGPISYRGALFVHAQRRHAAGDLEGALDSLEQAIGLAEDFRSNLGGLRAEDRIAAESTLSECASFAVRVAAELHARDGGDDLAARILGFLDFGRARALLEELEHPTRAAPAVRPLGLGAESWYEQRDRVLGPGDLLLAYDLDAQVAIGATRDEIRVHRLPPRETIDRRIDFARHALFGLRRGQPFDRHAAKLAADLLGPFEDLLARTERVLCLRSAALFRYPFDLMPRPGGKALGDGVVDRAFLFRTHVVEHVPCLGALVSRESATDVGPHRVLVLAYAAEANEAAPALPGVEREAEAIRTRVHAPHSVDVLVGDAAREAVVKKLAPGRYDVVQFATHAWADRTRGTASGILLAAGDGDDGRMTVNEIVELDLPLSLAVVSGCEGGAGQPFAGEGQVSVGWALLCAGARAALVASEPVEDRLLERFFASFYEAFLRDSDPASALRSARLAMLQAKEPWAREAAIQPFFVLIGAPSPR